MTRDDAADLTFVCPACEESLAVNEAMRDALVERGCVVCGAPLTTAAFTREGADTSDG